MFVEINNTKRIYLTFNHQQNPKNDQVCEFSFLPQATRTKF